MELHPAPSKRTVALIIIVIITITIFMSNIMTFVIAIVTVAIISRITMYDSIVHISVIVI